MRNWKASLIAKLHVAKTQIGMAEDDYRALLLRYGAASSKDMTLDELEAVLREMERMGFVPKPKTGTGRNPNPAPDKDKLIGKIRAMLTAKAEVQGRPVPWSYADAMAKRLCKVERVEWCDAQQLQKIIAALSYDQKRHSA